MGYKELETLTLDEFKKSHMGRDDYDEYRIEVSALSEDRTQILGYSYRGSSFVLQQVLAPDILIDDLVESMKKKMVVKRSADGVETLDDQVFVTLLVAEL